MEKLNGFFVKLFRNPALLWKLGASLIFLAFGMALLLMPSLTEGMSLSTKNTFAVVLLAYGLFRFATFYMEYKRSE